VLRLFPHAAPHGVERIGRPGPNAPVLVTGNFTLTVRRVKQTLARRDAWLLVANSNGINVWCAAGGGHLTHHEVIAAIRASGISQLVRHRDLVLPQLSASGIERRKITEATGWTATWGPARLEDLPEFLDRGQRVKKAHRFMHFPLWERLEMALVWTVPMTLMTVLAVGFFVGWHAGFVAAAVTVLMVSALFAALPWVSVTGRGRLLTYGATAVLGFVTGISALAVLGELSGVSLLALVIVSVGGMSVLSLDLTGTTPWYPGGINSLGNEFEVELADNRCSGSAECVQVCPRGVLQMNGKLRRVEIAGRNKCIRCGACVVQCPDDALRFRFSDGRVVEPATVRSTRLNLLGRRTVTL
jgi:NAD-dependent dihydropyrimidine dehydrogenase PreA subunit